MELTRGAKVAILGLLCLLALVSPYLAIVAIIYVGFEVTAWLKARYVVVREPQELRDE